MSTDRMAALGVDPKWVRSVVELAELRVQKPLRHEDVDLYEGSLHGRLHSSCMLLVGLYLQERDSEIPPHGEGLFGFATEYFAGDWRKSHMDQPTREGGSLWVDELRAVLGWAGALNQWSRLWQIAPHVNTDARDVGTFARERHWVGLLGHLAAGRNDDQLSAETRRIQQSPDARPIEKAVASCVSALLGGHSSFLSSLETFIRLYRKTLFRRNDLDCKVTLEGTYLYHEGARRNLVPSGDSVWAGIIRLSHADERTR